MLLTRAMRYYRLWIYVCNVALLASVAGFACVAGRIMLDPRRALVPATRSWLQPSFLYAYLALIAQCGALQLLGCVGALRLSERLLGAYWLLLLLLLCGDAIVGMAWAFRFDQVCAEVRPGLQRRLAEDYASDPSFSTTWDELQRGARCCGVVGARDFLPVAANHSTTTPSSGGQWWRRDGNNDSVVVPDSCCRTRRANETRCDVFPVGCEEHLLNWLRGSADTLFVLGYCVVAFIKLCFLGILRYEIREMIQKIKLMQGERDELAAPELPITTHGSPSASATTPLHMNHVGPPDRAPLLQRCHDCHPPVLCSPPVLAKLGNHAGGVALLGNGLQQQLANDGNDSDTNSHCALIVVDKPGANGNNNELHELQEMRLMARQTQI